MSVRHFLLPIMVAGSMAMSTELFAQDNVVTAPAEKATGNYKPWERIMEKDILWKKRVWREVDCNDKKNVPFLKAAASDNGQGLMGVLATGIKSGRVKIYSADDDRFTTELTYEQLLTRLNIQSGDNLQPYAAKYIVKEDWMYVKDTKKIEVRILGLAPVAIVVNKDATKSEKPLFWIYYPDNREFLSQYSTPDAGIAATWDNYFEGHHFGSEIKKVVEFDNK
jgi:gliding motility associated protien GldN